MYIKALTIQGFRTYRSETTIHFSPGYNCIVGSNGSGKSNILLAIAFALGEGGHSNSERRMLLHEGVNERCTEGFVELVLCNKDRRLCMYDSDEVRIRRCFSPSSDESFVQHKRISKAGLHQVLECAGFARGRSTPGGASTLSSVSTAYFIQQGRISQMALQSSAERLQLLQDVIGGTSFDLKAKEIQTLLKCGKREAERVQEQVESLGKKFDEMTEERKELRECLSLEGEKERIEYVIAELTWREACISLETNEKKSLHEEEKGKVLEERSESADVLREQILQQLEQIQLQIKRQTARRDEATRSQADLRGEEERVRLESEKCEKQEIQGQQKEEERKHLLTSLQQKLTHYEKKLAEELRPSMDRALKEYLAARYELQKAVQKRTSIQCKKDIIAARISRGQGERPGERREEEEEDEEESSGRSSALRDVSASLSSCEMEVQREIKQAEHLGKEESDLSKHYKAQIEELEEERKKLERELETCEESQAKALKEYKETEQKQHQVAKEFEAALEELRLQQADLADLLQQQTLARTAYETACDRFWQQLRSDIREGLQAAEAFCSERGWIESSSSRCKTSDMTQQERRRSNKKGGDKEKASYPVVAGMLLDFIEVPAEYRRAVESIGAHALTSFLVPDSKAAYELLSHLKGEGEGGGGKKKPTVSITVVPLKEVGELQRRREASNRACVMRKTFLQTLLDDEDEDVHVLPLPECISVNRHGGEEDSPRLSSENEALVSAYIRSVFGRALLVPSLSEQEETGRGGASHADFSVSSLHQKGFDCVTVDGDVSFSSGIVRGGGGGFSSYLLLPSSSSSFTSNEDSHQATDSLSTLRSVQTFSKLQAYQNMEDQRHRVDQVDRQVEEKKKKVAEIEARNGALIEKEQILSEARARCQAALEEIVQTRQHAEGRLRASEELLAAIQAEKKQAEERVNGIKSLIQDLRRESLSPDKNTGLPRTEEEALISLPRQIRSLEEKVNILSKKLEESKAAVEKASAEADIHLRKQIQRLERDEARSDLLHAKEQRGELEATLASINRRMLQEEEIIRKSDRQIKLLEDEVQEKQEELQLAEKQKQSILVELEDTVRKLQAFQQAVESARRSKEEAGAVLASTGGAAAAASEGGSLQNLRMLSMKDLASRLANLKKKLQAYEHVNRKAVDQFVNLRDEHLELKHRQEQQQRAQEAVEEQLKILLRRKQKAILHSFARVNQEFQTVFSALVPGGKAELVLQQSLLPDSAVGCFQEDETGGENERSRRKTRRSSTSSFNKKEPKSDVSRGASTRQAPERETGTGAGEEEEDHTNGVCKGTTSSLNGEEKKKDGDSIVKIKKETEEDYVDEDEEEEENNTNREDCPLTFIGVDIAAAFSGSSGVMAASTSASTRSSTKREDRQMKNVFPLVPLQSKHELKKTSLGEDKAGGAAHGMNQLSGGQKSIVSLALLLALQRVACCSPSEGRGASRISDYEGRSRGDGELQSFLSPSTTPQRDERRSRRRRANCAGERLGDHDEEEEEDEDEKDQQERLREQPGGVLLLDEVDAALDENHRRAAAEALRQTTAQRISQIILTTFRPELLDPADCFYHVSQANRVSHVDVVDIDTAIHLLQEQQGDEGNMEELEEDPRVKGEDEEAVSLPLPLTAH